MPLQAIAMFPSIFKTSLFKVTSINSSLGHLDSKQIIPLPKIPKLKRIGEQNYRQTTTADYRRGRRNIHEQSGTYPTRFGGGRVKGGNAGWLISEGIGAIEREMQQLNQAADFADRGLDAASEERKREQLRKRAELDRQSRERDEAARNANQSASDNESGNSSGSSKSR